MNDDRRRRLEAVLIPLLRLSDFSNDEAKGCCSKATPAYVTKTLGLLVRDGILQPRYRDNELRYHWICRPHSEFQPSQWIEQQIHGLQVKETPKHQRPRERLLQSGPSDLTDADLLAILIRVGVPKESAITGAQKIANRFHTRWHELANCSMAELKQISPAATQSSYAQIMAGIELGRRVVRAEAPPKTKIQRITSTHAAIEYCHHHFYQLANEALQEEFHVVTLDTKHKPIRTHQITVGTLDASLVHPREVFRAAIRDTASALILVHNHPSGDPTPSREDLQVTEQLTEAGKLLGISVLDHIVVASEACVSIRELT